jgi:NADH-ubiquinone oxidoreductase chain 5
LSNHAFFKALLFLVAGAILHALFDEQDLRKAGGLQNILPFSYIVLIIGSLALCGFPFLSGFFSKDTILELAFSKNTVFGFFCYILGNIAAFFTAIYSTRLFFLIFLSHPNGNKVIMSNASENS